MSAGNLLESQRSAGVAATLGNCWLLCVHLPGSAGRVLSNASGCEQGCCGKVWCSALMPPPCFNLHPPLLNAASPCFTCLPRRYELILASATSKMIASTATYPHEVRFAAAQRVLCTAVPRCCWTAVFCALLCTRLGGCAAVPPAAEGRRLDYGVPLASVTTRASPCTFWESSSASCPCVGLSLLLAPPHLSQVVRSRMHIAGTGAFTGLLRTCRQVGAAHFCRVGRQE